MSNTSQIRRDALTVVDAIHTRLHLLARRVKLRRGLSVTEHHALILSAFQSELGQLCSEVREGVALLNQ